MLTKKILKKLVREALESDIDSHVLTTGMGSKLVATLKDRLSTMENPDESKTGGWDKIQEDDWSYDDEEGGFKNKLDVNFKDPKNIVVSTGSENKKVFPLLTMDDVEKIIKYAEEISGLYEEGHKSEPTAISESVKRRFKLLANINTKGKRK